VIYKAGGGRSSTIPRLTFCQTHFLWHSVHFVGALPPFSLWHV
jgi:hypothetical protein